MNKKLSAEQKAKRAANRKKTNQFILEYRWDGRWIPLAKYQTRQAAEDYARTSQCCQSNGYQIRKLK